MLCLFKSKFKWALVVVVRGSEMVSLIFRYTFFFLKFEQDFYFAGTTQNLGGFAVDTFPCSEVCLPRFLALFCEWFSV